MRTSLCLLVFAIGAVPLAAQPDRRAFPARDFPPDMISPDDLPRNIVRVAPAHVRVDFENDRTRVLRLTLAPERPYPRMTTAPACWSALPGAASASPCRTAGRRTSN
jgi:hypothetical protein